MTSYADIAVISNDFTVVIFTVEYIYTAPEPAEGYNGAIEIEDIIYDNKSFLWMLTDSVIEDIKQQLWDKESIK